MKKIFLLCLVLFCSVKMNGQVSIGSNEKPQDFSILELESDGDKGLRIPQITKAERDSLTESTIFAQEVTDKAKGLVIYNTTTKKLEYWNGERWVEL